MEGFSKHFRSFFPTILLSVRQANLPPKNLRASNMVTGHIHRNIYTHSIHLVIGRCDMADGDDEIASAVHLLYSPGSKEWKFEGIMAACIS